MGGEYAMWFFLCYNIDAVPSANKRPKEKPLT